MTRTAKQTSRWMIFIAATTSTILNAAPPMTEGVAAIHQVMLGAASSAAVGATDDDTAIRQGMAQFQPGLALERIVASPVPGLYEVTVGSRLFYVSADGRYLIQGSMVDLKTKEDITENRLAEVRKASLAKIPGSKMVIFAPEHPKHHITVFTDLDCGYCRMLHRSIADYMKEGIEVRYLLFPRAGINSPSYDKAVTVWCSKDRNQALTDAKLGKDLPPLTCDNPIVEHMKLGEQMGVTGTPTIVLDDGRLLPGYMPADRMVELWNNQKK